MAHEREAQQTPQAGDKALGLFPYTITRWRLSTGTTQPFFIIIIIIIIIIH
jgi:hypothetical protein